MTRRVKTRCCGLTVQTGTKVIGFVSLVIYFGTLYGVVEIGYVIQFIIGIILSSRLNFQDDLFDPIHAFICISTAIVCSVSIVCSILLLRAAFKNDGSKLLIPWLVVDIILRCIHVIVLISGIILATRDTVSHGVATVIIMTFDIGLESYMWWIVLCFYRQLKSHETICVQAEPFELQDMHVY